MKWNPILAPRARADSEQAVLRVQGDIHPGRDEVRGQRGDPDAQVHVPACAKGGTEPRFRTVKV